MSSFNSPGMASAASVDSDIDDLQVIANDVLLKQSQIARVISQIPDIFDKQNQKNPTENFGDFFSNYRVGLLKAFDGLDLNEISKLALQLRETRKTGASIYVFGNGGSSSAATHLAADLGKIRFEDPSSYFRITSLSDNSALITATANDVGYTQVFAHQITRFVKPGDLVIAISSSGNSENIVEGLLAANTNDAETWSILGFTGGKAAKIADNQIYIPTNVGDYGFMEDVSSVIIHLLVTYIHEKDRKIFK